MAVQAQRVPQPPGIQMVGFGPAGRLALTVTLPSHRMHRENRVLALQELIDRSSLAGFDGHSQVGPGRGFLGKAFPTLGRVFEFKISNDFAFPIYDHYRVVLFSPIEASVMCEL